MKNDLVEQAFKISACKLDVSSALIKNLKNDYVCVVHMSIPPGSLIFPTSENTFLKLQNYFKHFA